ncbi:MAG: diguanylate cyclase [Candidatus Omnitrophica bacterium]|nr:diguanylate cyclase [Candidatus Omnitrophota bacterium]
MKNNKKKEKILIVDDDKEVARSIEEVLEREGYAYFTVHDGEQALLKFKEIKPSLVILDVDLPKVDGLTVCKKIKSEKKYTPVIMVTGSYTTLKDKIEGLEIGTDDYLIKPFDLTELIARTRTMLHLRGLYDELDKAKKLFEELSLTDPLTGVHNRRYLIKRLNQEIKRFGRTGDEFSCVIIDVDKFKHLNDTYGHLLGDDVLKKLAGVLETTTRETDIIARYGGDEFVIVAVDTDRNGTLILVEKLFKKIEKLNFEKNGQKINITISSGISSFNEKSLKSKIISSASLEEMIDKLIATADKSLYEAKKQEGNSVATSS